ncbi:MAG: Na+/H+ antiporter [Acetobacteraceae bacterium]|nr:Na+/H+ antiporter [Acetobacteraceae bacterium]
MSHTPVHIFESILLLLASAVALSLVARRLAIPPAAAFVVGGMALALTPGPLALTLDPDLTMVLFLPPLLQASAFFTVWRDFRANLRPILSLAIGCVAFTTCAVGWILKTLQPDLPWAACFAFGAIVSPPDAVTAASVLERLHIPRRLVTVLMGESLVNDASGIVLYRFAVAAALTGAFNPGLAALQFVYVALGGVAVGIGCGFAITWLLQKLHDTHLEIAISFLAGWLAYIAAEALGASGVLATVSVGLWLGRRGHTMFSAQTRLEARATWSFVIFVLEAMVFILIGLSLRGVLDRLGPDAWRMLPLAAEVTLATILIRFLWVLLATYLPPWIPPGLGKSRPPTFAVACIVSWAGMRGVVSLAVALALPHDFPGRDVVLFLTFVLICSTVLVQGTTLGPLIRALGIAVNDDGSERAIKAQARASMLRAQLALLEQQSQDDLLGPIARDMLTEFRDRMEEAALDTGLTGPAKTETAAKIGLRLAALQAARAHALEQNRAGSLHDAILLSLERELDVEEIRLRADLRSLG